MLRLRRQVAGQHYKFTQARVTFLPGCSRCLCLSQTREFLSRHSLFPPSPVLPLPTPSTHQGHARTNLHPRASVIADAQEAVMSSLAAVREACREA